MEKSMGSLREQARRVERGLDIFEKWFMILLTSALTIVTFLQVFTRYVLRNPFFWTEEMARILFIWVCMIGVAMGIGAKGHYGFEAVYKLFPKGLRFLCALVVYGVIGLFAVVLIVKGFEELHFAKNQAASTLPITMAWVYVALPVGGILMLVHHLLNLIAEGPPRWHASSDEQG
jgi:TRAP-type transport system small permease protein